MPDSCILLGLVKTLTHVSGHMYTNSLTQRWGGEMKGGREGSGEGENEALTLTNSAAVERSGCSGHSQEKLWCGLAGPSKLGNSFHPASSSTFP